MNLFYLDHDIDLCAQYHIDSHVGKMQLEAAQILSTTLWVDQEFGFVPRALNKEELAHLRGLMAEQPATMAERNGPIRYKAAHHNHPCTIWCRSSQENYEWTFNYVDALNRETQWRGNKPHASCAEVQRLPEPKNLRAYGLTPIAQAMPDEYKSDDPVDAYRHYYMGEKADFAVWKHRGKPWWWDEMLVTYSDRDPHESWLNVQNSPTNKKNGLKL